MFENPDQHSAPHKGFSPEEALGRSRVDHYLVEASLKWVLDCSQLQAELGVKNQFGGSSGYFKALEMLYSITDEHIDKLLEELGNAVTTRGKLWTKLHDYAAEQAIEQFKDAAEKTDAMMSRGATYAPVATGKVARIHSNMVSKIRVHQAGWTAPKAETLEERYPLVTKVVLILLGFALGLATTALSNAFSSSPSEVADRIGPEASTPEPRSSDASTRRN